MYRRNMLKGFIITAAVALGVALAGRDTVKAGPTRWAYDVNSGYTIHMGGDVPNNSPALSGHAYKVRSYTRPQAVVFDERDPTTGDDDLYSVAFNWMQIDFGATGRNRNGTAINYGRHIVEAGHFKRYDVIELGFITYSGGDSASW